MSRLSFLPFAWPVVGMSVLLTAACLASTAYISRLQSEGLNTEIEEQTTCCYAAQDKVWVHGPDAEPWEVYTVLADAAVMRPVDAACCASTATTEPVAPASKSTACC